MLHNSAEQARLGSRPQSGFEALQEATRSAYQSEDMVISRVREILTKYGSELSPAQRIQVERILREATDSRPAASPPMIVSRAPGVVVGLPATAER